MADKKISELPAASGITPEDLLLLIDNPNESPTSKNISIEDFFKEVPVDSHFKNLTADSLFVDSLEIETTGTPSSSTDDDAFSGNIAFDSNYLYIKVGNRLKRVKLEDF